MLAGAFVRRRKDIEKNRATQQAARPVGGVGSMTDWRYRSRDDANAVVEIHFGRD